MSSARSGIFADDSITRRVNRENVLLLGGGRALLMQLAHPLVAQGVDEHSDFRSHPIRRLRRTIRMTMAMVFGDRDTVMAAARAVNRAHASVRGPEYDALDPDLLLWVHATLVDSALVTYETFVQRLSAGERETFYQESKEIGRLLGIPPERFSDDLDGFAAYLKTMLSSGPVRVNERARELAVQVLRPRLGLLPGRAMIPLELITAGLLPETLRVQYGLAWGPGRRRLFRAAVKAVPRLVAVTPPLLRVWPLPGRNVGLGVSA
ncbi:MAG: oxygenase MpaB family protein [Candidatus Dormibacterales bacterium]